MKPFANLYGYFSRACGWTKIEQYWLKKSRRRDRRSSYHAALADALEPRMLMSSTYYWTNANSSGGNWTDASNWSGGPSGGVPGVNDTAVFPATATVHSPVIASGTSITVGAIQIDDSQTAYSITGTGVLSVGSGGITIANSNGSVRTTTIDPSLSASANQTWSAAGTGSANTTVDLAGNLDVSNATLTLSGSVAIVGSPNITVEQTANLIISNGLAEGAANLLNYGTVNWAGGNWSLLGSGANITNEYSGTLNLRGQSSAFKMSDTYLYNYGTLTWTSGNWEVDPLSPDDYGVSSVGTWANLYLNAPNNTLTLNGAMFDSDGGTFWTAGAIQVINGGELYCDGDGDFFADYSDQTGISTANLALYVDSTSGVDGTQGIENEGTIDWTGSLADYGGIYGGTVAFTAPSVNLSGLLLGTSYGVDGANNYEIPSGTTASVSSNLTISDATLTIEPGGNLNVTNSASVDLADAYSHFDESTTFTATAGESSGTQPLAYFLKTGTASSASNYTASVNWGDGTTTTGNVVASTDCNYSFEVTGNHTYPSEGDYTPTVTITTSGVSNVVSDSVSVQPVLTIAGANTTIEGVPYTLNLSAAGLGSDTISSWSIQWGDGPNQSILSNPSSVTHNYTTSGLMTISATATDQDGTHLGSDSWTVDVLPPPTAVVENVSVSEGGFVGLSAAGSADSAPGAVLTYAWDLNGDGVFGEIGSAATNGDEVGISPVFSSAGLSPGDHTISLRVCDQFGQSAQTTAVVDVLPVPPSGILIGSNIAVMGASYQLTLQALPADLNSVVGWNINWGDGSDPDGDGQPGEVVSGASMTISHTYATVGYYRITASALDTSGTEVAANDSVAVHVMNPDNGIQQSITGLYNTGTELNSDNTDKFWTVQSLPSGEAVPAELQTNLYGGALASAPNVNWITSPPHSNGTFAFQTTFNLSSDIPSSASLQLSFSAAERVTSIELNGNIVFTDSPHADDDDGYQTLVIPAGSPFVSGVNTLSFIANNLTNDDGYPTGRASLSVSIAGSAFSQEFLPTLTLSDTANNAPVTSPIALGTAVSLLANATVGSETIGTTANIITGAQFYDNGQLVGSGTYSDGNWTLSYTPTTIGTHDLVAEVFDEGGLSSFSNVTVSVAPSDPPSVVITSPISGMTDTSGVPITLTAQAAVSNALDNVNEVQFFDEHGNLLGSGTPDANGNVSVTWTPASTGQYSISAEALDSLDLNGWSAPVLLTVGSAVPPTVTLIAPASGLVVLSGSTLQISAQVVDPNMGGATGAEFYAQGNGTPLGAGTLSQGTVSNGTWTFNWQNSPAGTYLLTASATDPATSGSTAQAARLTIVNDTTPTALLTSPAAQTELSDNVTVTLEATAATTVPNGLDPLSQVQFFDNGTLIGNGTLTNGTWSLAWQPNVVGSHVLVVKAITANGKVGTSSSNLTVFGFNTPPITTATFNPNSLLSSAPQPIWGVGDVFVLNGGAAAVDEVSPTSGKIVRVLSLPSQILPSVELVTDQQAITFDSKGDLFVANGSYEQVYEFGPDGTFVRTINVTGSPLFADNALEVINPPDGVVTDGAGNLYVNDSYSTIDRYSPTGGLADTVTPQWSQYQSTPWYDDPTVDIEAMAMSPDQHTMWVLMGLTPSSLLPSSEPYHGYSLGTLDLNTGVVTVQADLQADIFDDLAGGDQWEPSFTLTALSNGTFIMADDVTNGTTDPTNAMIRFKISPDTNSNGQHQITVLNKYLIPFSTITYTDSGEIGIRIGYSWSDVSEATPAPDGKSFWVYKASNIDLSTNTYYGNAIVEYWDYKLYRYDVETGKILQTITLNHQFDRTLGDGNTEDYSSAVYDGVLGNSGQAQTPYTYTASAGSPNDLVTYTLIRDAHGATIDPASGTMTWTPEAAGNYTFTILATDSQGAQATQTFTVTVVAAGRATTPPSISTTELSDGRINRLYQNQINATDPNNDRLTFSLVPSGDGETVPTCMTIDPDSGIISWVPLQQYFSGDPTVSHTIGITVCVTDASGLSTNQFYDVTFLSIEAVAYTPFANTSITVTPDPSSPDTFDLSASTDYSGSGNVTYSWASPEIDPKNYAADNPANFSSYSTQKTSLTISKFLGYPFHIDLTVSDGTYSNYVLQSILLTPTISGLNIFYGSQTNLKFPPPVTVGQQVLLDWNGIDQFGNIMASGVPEPIWSVTGSSANGTIDQQDGLYIAPETPGTYTITGNVTVGSQTFSAMMNITVSAQQDQQGNVITDPTTEITIPSTPTGLQAGWSGGGRVGLLWDYSGDPDGLLGFDVYRSTDPNFLPSASALVGSSDDDECTDDNVPSGTFYYRVVAAYQNPLGGEIDSGASDPASVATLGAPGTPAAPTNLTLSEVGGNVVLNWVDNSVNEAGFEIRRSTGGGTWTLIGRVAQNGTAFNDTSAQDSTNYQYEVAAYTINSDSSLNYSAFCQTPFNTPNLGDVPNVPTSLNATESTTQIILTWSAPTGTVVPASYDIYRRLSTPDDATDSNAFVQINTIPSTTLSYTDTSAQPGAVYDYEVTALSATSAQSAPVVATGLALNLTTSDAAPVVEINSPVAYTPSANDPTDLTAAPTDNRITALTNVAITVAAVRQSTVNGSFQPDIGSWSLVLQPLGGGNNIPLTDSSKFHQLTVGTVGGAGQVACAVDPSLYPSGLYNLVLTATDAEGRSASTSTLVSLFSNVKLGGLTLPVTDLSINIPGGQPLTITRTYNSQQANVAGVLGYGWQLQLSNDSVINTTVQTPGETNLAPMHVGDYVYVTAPNGQQYTFEFLPVPEDYEPQYDAGVGVSPYDQNAYAGSLYNLEFVSVDGSGAKLSVPGDVYTDRNDRFTFQYDPESKTLINAHALESDDEEDALFFPDGSPASYNPSNTLFGDSYTLTTSDGTEYDIDSNNNTLLVTDPNGNSASYSNTTGRSGGYALNVVPEDASDVVKVQVINSSNQSIIATVDYQLNSSNQLVSVHQENTSSNTTYAYWPSSDVGGNANLLKTVTDARGIPVLNAQYDDLGTLTSLTDAEGHAASVGTGGLTSTGASQQVTAANGDTTQSVYDAYGDVTRTITTLKNSAGVITGYSVAVTQYTYDTANLSSDLPDLVVQSPSGQGTQPGATNTNALLSVSTYQPFMLGAGSFDQCFTQAPTILLQETNYYSGNGQVTLSDPDLHQISTEAVYAGQDASGNLLYQVTHYADYVLGKPGSVTQTLDTRNANGTTLSSMTLSHTSTTYDSGGNATETTDAAGNQTYYEYTTADNTLAGQPYAGLPIGLLLRSYTTLRAGFDPSAPVNQLTLSLNAYYMPADASTSGASVGRLKYSIDASGEETYYAYNALGDTTLDYTYKTWTGAAGQTLSAWVGTTSQYDAMGRLTETVQQEYADTGKLDAAGYPVLDTQAAVTNVVVTGTTAYTADGQTDTTTDQYGNVTRYTYDAKGNQIRVLYPDGTEVRTTYDTLGRVVWQTDRYKTTTTYNTATGTYTDDNATTALATETLYDSMGRTVGTVRASGMLISMGTALAGTVSLPTTTAPSTVTTVSTTATVYNDAGQAVESVDAAGLRTGTIYYPDGSVQYTGPLDPAAPATWYTSSNSTQYFMLNAPTGRREYTSYLYNQLDTSTGNPYSGLLYDRVTDANGHSTDTYKDSSGRTLFTVYDDGSFTQTLYSQGDEQIPDATLPSGVVTPTVAQGWPGVPAGGTETIQFAQRKPGDTPQATFYLYDASGNLADVFSPPVADALHGNTMTPPHTHYAYDASGHEIAEIDANGHTTTFTYDENGNELSRTLPSGHEETFTYNPYGQQVTHTDFNGNVATSIYYSSGQSVGGITQPVGALEQVVYTGAAMSGKATQTVTYTYDAMGRQATVTDASGTTTDHYDAEGNLIEQDTPEGTMEVPIDVSVR
jgi:YD repeat-containing protein